MIQDTSQEIYLKKVYPNLYPRQAIVLHYLRNVGQARTNAEIKTALGWEINQVTGRVKELRDQGLVIDSGTRRCTVTGNRAHAWIAKHPVLPPAFEEKEEKPIQNNQSTLL